MEKNDESRSDLSGAVIRVCPACCTVNPSGPSTTCPHVQLVRFEGVGAALEALLADVASARRTYNDLNAKLKAAVLEAVKDGAARIETPHRPHAGAGEAEHAALAHPTAVPAAKERARVSAKRRRAGAPAVDPRQLTLLAFSPPKGDA